MTNINYFANLFGVLSLFACAIATLPTAIDLLNSYKHKRVILQIGRYGLLSAVCLGLTHGLLMTQQDNIDFYDLNTYWIYAVGLFSFNLLIFIAFMYTELRLNFKQLSYISYAALLLLAIHVGQAIF